MITAVSIFILLLTAALALTVTLPKVTTVSGASVMAFAIFTQGVLVHAAGKGSAGTKTLAALTLLLWLFLLAAYVGSVRDGSFKERHWDDPLGRFAIGTWVAGTSSALTAAHVNFPELHAVLVPLGILNAGLLIFYLFAASLAAGEIAARRLHFKLNGIILLTVVAIQSVCLMLHELFGTTEYMMYRVLVLLGLLFYLAGLTLLILRYRRRDWKLTDDWPETNCTLHGSIAITGAAALKSFVFPDGVLLGIWIFTLLMLLLVEGMEIVRAVLRIRKYGWVRRIGVYAPAQWSRLFTLGMFYFFTQQAQRIFPQDASSTLSVLREWILYGGAWIIIFLISIETLLWMLRFQKRSSAHREQET
ncbi:hypothetical protein [Saccharibacillus kuerlensis]|uniref:Voltage-dependent anion channel n=1 Tax=Saccharibacillus kuerlensis TaxID=459527 RepID=A0ABQ2KW95_9BACL|nr:hypothetical protein [Saccharibacillus kuerlensis]GGN94696.1 hypothetical protein GCM10010969_09600 [Saccharibacillus kuerlensis]